MLISNAGYLAPLPPTQEASRERFPPLYLLILEANNQFRTILKKIARSRDFIVSDASDVSSARAIIKSQTVDILMLDLNMESDRRSSFFDEVRALHPETEIIVSADQSDLSSAIDTVRSGAMDYVTKAFDSVTIAAVLDRSREQFRAAIRSRRLRERFRSQKKSGELSGQSSAIENVRSFIRGLAQSMNPVLITGESGAGKELVARTIHFGIRKSASPFVVFDCRSLASDRRGSELFGHVKLAFPGAHTDYRGILASADTGTIVLNEVTELPLTIQGNLVRSLRERKITPIGGHRSIPVSLTVIGTTSQNVATLVEKGRFRRDLYSYLNVSHVKVPPLRERLEDVPSLARYFIDRINQQTLSHRVLSDDLIKILSSYTWPGNVRELENAIEYACFRSSNEILNASDFPLEIHEFAIARLRAHQDLKAFETRGSHSSVRTDETLVVRPIADIERDAILKTLNFTNGDKRRAARLLGVGKTTLYRKLKEYGYDHDVLIEDFTS